MEKGVEINPEKRFGKPVIKGTRITVDEVLGALAAGMTYEEIEKEYGVKKDDVLAALQDTELWIREHVD